ncbi:MAG TPA: hypothetical protein VM911_17620 [Pyrinomonadaceae bacterium]|nr:hypothetical protein [Pyrinomonadaceae bacterium]
MIDQRKFQTLKFILLLVLALVGAGCNTLAKKDETGVIIARRAQVRSSTAVVAADLVEVNRGDVVDILGTDEVEGGERWLRVRAHDEENTEGWIEARNIMPLDVLDRARKLAEEDKDTPVQATGQLRASTNLRLSPDRTGNDNILMKLESGSSFEIVGWKRVPKPKTDETLESDDAPKAGSAQQSAQQNSGRKQSDAPKEPEEANELWYKVRLGPSISPAPAGWIYGKQVELTVPSDIIFYRTGREFVAWHRLDDDPAADTAAATKDKDVGKEIKPGSWVILEKSSSNEPHKLDEPDFDRIYVLGYDKINQEHYTAYRSPDLKGFLPLRVEGRGDNKTFTVKIGDDSGQKTDAQYTLYRDDRGVLKIAAPNEQPRQRKRR